MTVIGTFKFGETTFIIADILLTADKDWKPVKSIPSLGFFDQLIGKKKDRIASNIVQKVIMLDLKSIISFAGTQKNGTDFIKELRKIKRPLNVDIIEQLIQNYKEKLEILSITPKEKKKILIKTGDDIGDFNYFKKLSAIGAGKEKFYQKMNEIDQNFTNAFPFLKEKYTKKEKNLELIHLSAIALGVMTEFLNMDFFNNGGSLNNNFGGFYEILIERNLAFRKLASYKYCIWLFSKQKATLDLLLYFDVNYDMKYNLYTINRYNFAEDNEIEPEIYEIPLMQNLYRNKNNLKIYEKNFIIDIPLLYNSILMQNSEKSYQFSQLFFFDENNSLFSLKNTKGNSFKYEASPILKKAIIEWAESKIRL